MPAHTLTKNFQDEKIPNLFPYPVSYLSQKPWKTFLSKNGYVNLSKKLMLKVFSTEEEIEDLWKRFSEQFSVFDLWEVRCAFWKAYNFSPYFISLLKGNSEHSEVIGLLPLWHNSDKLEKGDDPDECDAGKFVWFGSNWPEDNVFNISDPELIPLLLTAAPSPLELACIRPKTEYEFLKDFPQFTLEEEEKYFLNLERYKTVDEYLSKLKKKKRYNLKRDRKKILSLRPQIFINRKNDLEELFNLNIMRFREVFPDEPDEHSAFEDERRKNVFRNLSKYSGNYETRIITTVINGQIEAVEFGLVYNKTYFALNAGADISSYSGLGVFSNLLVIEDAVELGCKKIDFLEGDNNWKESWHLDHLYQYQFKK